MPKVNDIFVSYGRAESRYFATKLNNELIAKGYEVWFDQEDIPLGVDFQEQINEGIQSANIFIFIIAPHSVRSEYCRKEIEYAIKLNKRIVPLLHVQLSPEEEKNFMHPVIAKLNWINFRQEINIDKPQKQWNDIDNFDNAFEGLSNIINEEKEYLTKHTEYLVRAIEWEKSDHKKKHLLKISELEPATEWVNSEFDDHTPTPPTKLHKKYIRESKKSKYMLSTQQMDARKDIFISYSRRSSLEFVWDLFMNLTDKGYEVWFDQNDIPLGVDFQEQINAGITNADAFVFIISPTSIRSKYCLREIQLAVEQGKRIIPIVHIKPQDDEMKYMHPVIEKLNWVYMQEDIDDIKKSMFELRKFLKSHINYVKLHTKILKKAINWEKNQRANQLLLVGNERKKAEEWLQTKFSKEQPPCLPSDLMCEFIAESKKNANNLMTEVFIAYDVDDIEKRDEINKYLIRQGYTTWIHQTDIKAGLDYSKSIEQGIEQADNLVFLISPKSIKSEYCLKELTYALKFNKRIIPVLIEPTSNQEMPAQLKPIQFIDFTHQNKDEVEEGKYFSNENLKKILKELNKDRRYFEEHKVILNQALKWKRQNRNSSILMRGYNLDQAKTWFKMAKLSSYPPTDFHQEFINESIANVGQLHTDIFISYSRTDGDFARKINENLQLSGKNTWFDQESIASGADFQKEIYNGIEQADNFLFIISPESVRSEYCADEVEYAGNLNKRFVTILYRPTPPEDIHPLLSAVQWIDFNSKEFQTSYNELLRTVDIDREYVQNHTKWSQMGIKWIENDRDNALLLRGNEFALADTWLKNADEKNKNPRPTDIQREFISESHAAILAAERRKKRGVLILRALLVVAVILLILSAIAGVLALRESKKAKENAIRATKNAKIANQNAVRAEKGEYEARKAQSEAEEYAKQVVLEKNIADSAKQIAEIKSKEAIFAKNKAEKSEEETKEALKVATYNKLKADTAKQEALLANNRSMYHLYVFNAKEFAVKSISIEADNPAARKLKAQMAVMAYELKEVADDYPYTKYYDPELLKALQNSYLEYKNNDIATGETWGLDFSGNKIALSTQLGEVLFADVSKSQSISLPTIKNIKGKSLIRSELVRKIKYNSNGTITACGTSLGNIYIFDRPSDYKKYELGKNRIIFGLDFIPDTDKLIVSTDDGNLTFFDTKNMSANSFKLNYVLNDIVAINKNYFASAGSNGTIGWHKINNPQNPQFLYNSVRYPFRSIDYCKQNNWIVAGNSTGELICVYDFDNKSTTILPRKHKGIVASIKFSDDGKWLATGGLDGIVMLWYIEGNDDISKLVPIVIENSSGKIFSLAFDNNSKYLIYTDSKNLKIVPLNDKEIYDKLNKLLKNKKMEDKDWMYYKRGNLSRPGVSE